MVRLTLNKFGFYVNEQYISAVALPELPTDDKKPPENIRSIVVLVGGLQLYADQTPDEVYDCIKRADWPCATT